MDFLRLWKLFFFTAEIIFLYCENCFFSKLMYYIFIFLFCQAYFFALVASFRNKTWFVRHARLKFLRLYLSGVFQNCWRYYEVNPTQSVNGTNLREENIGFPNKSMAFVSVLRCNSSSQGVPVRLVAESRYWWTKYKWKSVKICDWIPFRFIFR